MTPLDRQFTYIKMLFDAETAEKALAEWLAGAGSTLADTPAVVRDVRWVTAGELGREHVGRQIGVLKYGVGGDMVPRNFGPVSSVSTAVMPNGMAGVKLYIGALEYATFPRHQRLIVGGKVGPLRAERIPVRTERRLT